MFRFAAVVVLRASDGVVVEEQTVTGRVNFPYVPGLLSFRELPALLSAFATVRHPPDAVMLDGQGVAHPRRFGVACHLGLWLGRPCLGCAKSRLVGDHAVTSVVAWYSSKPSLLPVAALLALPERAERAVLAHGEVLALLVRATHVSVAH